MQPSLTILLLSSWLAIAVVGIVIILVVRRFRPDWFRNLLPPQRDRAIAWDGIDIIFLFFMVYALIPSLTISFLEDSGFNRWYFGISRMDKGAPLERMNLWALSLAFPLRILVFYVLLRARGRLEPYQLGLTRTRLPQNILVGFIGWLLVTPVAFGILAVAVSWIARNEDHQLVKISANAGGISEWVLMVFTAAIDAPIIEELLFRGILQKWTQKQTWRPDLAVVLAFAVSLVMRGQDLQIAMSSVSNGGGLDTAALGRGLAPALFILLMLPGYVYSDLIAWRWLPYPNAGRTIYATSLLFASVHSAVWPSPIALFPLSLGLGYVAFRTQSVIPSITMHSLFNLVSTLVLIVAPEQLQDRKGSEETSALRAPPSSSRVVPAASLPRRTYPSASTVAAPGE
jgi:membrane protease YdiL (CAAX protease family)